MYAGVPHCSVIVSPFLTILETPKSQILISPLADSRILSSLMSLWRTLFEWQYANPSINYLNKLLATSSFNYLLLRTYVKRSPPAQTSMTNRMCFGVSKYSYSLTMFLWRVLFKMIISCITFFDWESSEKYVLLIDLIATISYVSKCSARFTFPKAPLPRILPTR